MKFRIEVHYQRRWGGGPPKIKVPQNIMKHILVLEFVNSNEIIEFWLLSPNNQPHMRVDALLTR